MSSLRDRHEHRRPGEQDDAVVLPAWRDYALTVLFAVFGLIVTAFALIEKIPLFDDAIWNG